MVGLSLKMWKSSEYTFIANDRATSEIGGIKYARFSEKLPSGEAVLNSESVVFCLLLYSLANIGAFPAGTGGMLQNEGDICP